jgi:hypothetical protein
MFNMLRHSRKAGRATATKLPVFDQLLGRGERVRRHSCEHRREEKLEHAYERSVFQFNERLRHEQRLVSLWTNGPRIHRPFDERQAYAFVGRRSAFIRRCPTLCDGQAASSQVRANAKSHRVAPLSSSHVYVVSMGNGGPGVRIVSLPATNSTTS